MLIKRRKIFEFHKQNEKLIANLNVQENESSVIIKKWLQN